MGLRREMEAAEQNGLLDKNTHTRVGENANGGQLTLRDMLRFFLQESWLLGVQTEESLSFRFYRYASFDFCLLGEQFLMWVLVSLAFCYAANNQGFCLNRPTTTTLLNFLPSILALSLHSPPAEISKADLPWADNACEASFLQQKHNRP